MTAPLVDRLQAEDGTYLLDESGDYLLIEGTLVQPESTHASGYGWILHLGKMRLALFQDGKRKIVF
jgi:hypothetical protein